MRSFSFRKGRVTDPLHARFMFPRIPRNLTKDTIWIEAFWVREELSRRGMLISYVQSLRGELLVCKSHNGNKATSVIHSFISSLKACIDTLDLYQGSRLHACIRNSGLLDKSTHLSNMLVTMYAKCGALVKAQQALQELSVRDVVTWNALISGYVQHGQGDEALRCYQQMRSEGLSPDSFTYASILKACAIARQPEMGKNFHDEIRVLGLLQCDVVLGNAVVDMYAKCGLLAKAQEVVDELPMRNVVTWSALITGYAQQEQGTEALRCYRQMQKEDISSNAITYASILKACGITKDIDTGKQIHDEVAYRGLLEKDVVLGNALVDMYAKCGALTLAQEVLQELPVRDVISWSALIAGYSQQGQGEEALGCFQQMRKEGLSPNGITFVCILKACGMTLEVDMGTQIHDEIVRQGLLPENVILGTALVDMYAKCGALTKAQKTLDKLAFRDVTTWNAIIAGYAQQGHVKEVLNCFEQMRSEGLSPNIVCWNSLIGGYAQQGLAEEALGCFQRMQQEGNSPDAITFVNLINACSHAGLVDEGQMCFENMIEKYDITPDKEHQTCMVDLFGRATHVGKALRVIERMPFSDYPPVWSALLSACRQWGNVKLGRLAFENAVQLDGGNVGAYILLANTYAAAGMQEQIELLSP